MSSRRNGSTSSQPVIQIRHLSKPISHLNVLKGTQQVQYVITLIAVVFVLTSGIISMVGSESLGAFIFTPLSQNSKYSKLLSGSTSSPALTKAEWQDRTWSDDKCRAEFPLFYPQLEELARYWKKKGGIKKWSVDTSEGKVNRFWGYARLIIRNRKVYVRSFSESRETRNSALIYLISMAINSWPTSSKIGSSKKEDSIPAIDMIFSPGDKDTFLEEGGWTVTKPSDGREPGMWLLPDFGFVSWPEAGAGFYEDFVEKAEQVEEEYPWKSKEDKLFWRGFPNFYPVRLDLMNRVSNATDPSRDLWADIHQTTFHDKVGGINYPLVSLPDHCKHKFLIHTEGNSYSGRSKYLFSCRSVTVVHPLEWTQHFHPALNGNPHSPNQNYVQLPGPHFSGLEQAALELRKAAAEGYSSNAHHYIGRKDAEEIAKNAVRTLRDRYLSPAATMCYTRAALRYYANALDASSWGPNGPELIPGEGVAPDASKGKPMGHLKGDIEVGVWRLLGAPEWPPRPDKVEPIAASSTIPEPILQETAPPQNNRGK